MVEVKDLKKIYNRVKAVNIAHLFIPQGESFGLVGNNGAGKTTFFRMILDLVPSTHGEIHIDQINVAESEEWKYFTGSFLDEKFLIGYLTPEEYFEFLAKTYKLNNTDLAVHLNKFEELFNDEILGKNKYIRDLSKGNKKKVGIAGALLGNPKLVLLDEPFENLDPTSQARLKQIINNHRKERDVTFMVSSHDLSQVTEITDRIVLLEKGKVYKDLKVNDSTLQELKDYFESAAMANQADIEEVG